MAKFPKYARLASGTYDNPGQTVEDITVIENNLEGGGDVSVTSDDITDATDVGRDVLTAANAAAVRTAIGAGTSSLALGTSGTTAKAGDYVPAWTDVTGKPATFAPIIGATATTAVAGNDTRLTAGTAGTATVRAIGITATTAAAGNDARLLTGSATAINTAETFTDLDTATTAYNTLLTALRARGIITGT